MQEIWKTIEGHSRYEVSNLGRVRDIKKNKLLDIYVERNHKYAFLALDIGGNRKRSVGLLVAQAFVPKPSFDCSKVRYKDGNYLNCEASNIDWIPSKKSAQNRKKKRLAEASGWGYRQHMAGNQVDIRVERESGGIRGFFHFEGDGAFFLGISLARMRRVLNGEEEIAGWRVTKMESI